MDVGREREEVERPLVAMDRLARRVGADRDDLGEVDLDLRRLVHQPLGDVEHERVLDELAGRLRPGDQATGSFRAAPREVVGAERRGVDVVGHLGRDPVDQLDRGEFVDHERALCSEHTVELLGRWRWLAGA